MPSSSIVCAADRLALTSDLRRRTPKRGWLHYQPLIESSGRCFGAEALLRWNHPTRGAITPAEFIPLAERSGFMASIDEWVLRTACATLTEWAADPLTRDLRLAVNISAGQLNGAGFVEFVEETLRETGANPRRLALELTEHAMLDDIEAVGCTMLMLKAMGVGLSLDDFGTGYSSLSYLKRLPIDTLKIDSSFVRDIEGDQSGRAIVQSILSIARSLDVSVIAEGVETESRRSCCANSAATAFGLFLCEADAGRGFSGVPRAAVRTARRGRAAASARDFVEPSAIYRDFEAATDSRCCEGEIGSAVQFLLDCALDELRTEAAPRRLLDRRAACFVPRR